MMMAVMVSDGDVMMMMKMVMMMGWAGASAKL